MAIEARISTDQIFYTLQGEGPMIGVPSLFLRLDNCNLKCKWGNTLCDAHYTSWHPEGFRMDLHDLEREILIQMNTHNCRHLVITGGEPALQKEVVTAVAALVRGMGGHSTIETNGTIYIPNTHLDLICISPKLESSVPYGTRYEKVHARNRWKPLEVSHWMSAKPYYFKYVIDRVEDIKEVMDQLREVGQKLPDPDHVVFMPQGITKEELWERGKWVAEICKEMGVRFTPRIQIDLWGNKPGT